MKTLIIKKIENLPNFDKIFFEDLGIKSIYKTKEKIYERKSSYFYLKLTNDGGNE